MIHKVFATSHQTIQRHLFSLTVGIAAGGTVGLVGFGGAQVIIPSLTIPASFANLTQLSATGVSLASLSVSSLASGYRFWDENKVHAPLALAIGVPSVASAHIGSRLAKRLSGNALALVFNGFSIVLLPTHFWIQHRRQARLQEEAVEASDTGSTTAESDFHTPPHPSKPIDASAPKMMQHASCGILCGVLSALMGVGGLPFTMSYLTEFTDLPHHSVQGTAVCAMLPSILVSAASRIASIPLVAAACVALGSTIGGYSGANLALHLSEDQLRHLYMGSLAVFGSRSVFGAARNIKHILHR